MPPRKACSSLPAGRGHWDDVRCRGLAELDETLKVKGNLVLGDYPFAEDGLLVWNAIVDYFTEYLQLYYSDSGAGGRPKVLCVHAQPGWPGVCLRVGLLHLPCSRVPWHGRMCMTTLHGRIPVQVETPPCCWGLIGDL